MCFVYACNIENDISSTLHICRDYVSIPTLRAQALKSYPCNLSKRCNIICIAKCDKLVYFIATLNLVSQDSTRIYEKNKRFDYRNSLYRITILH